jgi:hypothetical protein
MKTSIRMTLVGVAATLGLMTISRTVLAADRYTVHEWGTFTVLQDENGDPLPGVNVNEESLPPFVHRLSPRLLPNGGDLSPFRGRHSKGIASSYPAALMRMETPIIYIYPPDGKSASKLDVGVRFRGGWISEWYPNAAVEAPGFDPKQQSLGKMTPSTVGSIRWNNLTIGGDKQPPKTDEHVWLAPRNVAAPVLTTKEGLTERYLFYRGVANIEAPLRVVRDNEQNTLSIHGNLSDGNLVQRPMRFNAVWMADIRAGSVAFRQLSSLTFTGKSMSLATIPAQFVESDYEAGNMIRLRASMKKALLAEGLFEDEAEAMLNTWKLSYFQSPGLRLFFTLPRDWTDEVLPLTVSEQSDVVRAMIGRIEIVTPKQRTLLKQLAQSPVSDTSWLSQELAKLAPEKQGEAWAQLIEGKRSVDDYDLQVPEDYRTFLSIGRFRDALVLNELEQRPTATLQNFVKNYRLHFQAAAAPKNANPRPARPVAGE